MRVDQLKEGDVVILRGQTARVKGVESYSSPDKLLVHAYFPKTDNDKYIPILRDAELEPGSEGVNLDYNSIMGLFEATLRRQLKKGYERYGKNSINPDVTDVIDYALEEAVDLVVYLYVAKVDKERKNGRP